MPTSLKLMLGERGRGRRPINDKEPKVKIALPPAPDDLDLVAKKEWRRVARYLYDLGIMSSLDTGVLHAYCVAHSDDLHYRRTLRREGAVLTAASTGRRYKNPVVSLAAEARRDKLKCAVEMGMTPSARTRIRVDEIPKLETDEDAGGANRDEFLDEPA